MSDPTRISTARPVDGDGRENDWLRTFAVATTRSAELAARYLLQVQDLQAEWRQSLASLKVRSDAAVWRLIEVLPAHPILSQPVAVGATGRSRPAVQQAIDQLVRLGVLRPLSSGKRNRHWEAVGLLDLATAFETLSSHER